MNMMSNSALKALTDAQKFVEKNLLELAKDVHDLSLFETYAGTTKMNRLREMLNFAGNNRFALAKKMVYDACLEYYIANNSLGRSNGETNRS